MTSPANGSIASAFPAKSGVGGGIIAALPAQFGLGTFSPRLDEHGNSVRGLKVCEAVSARFDLHMLNRTSDVRTCIVADYDFARVSPRGRQPHEQKILDEHENAVRVLELTGALSFANVDLIARRIHAKPLPQVLILDFGRVPMVSTGAAKLLANLLDTLHVMGATAVVSGIERGTRQLRGDRRACSQKKRGCATSRCSTRRSSGRKTRSFSASAVSRICSTRRTWPSRNCWPACRQS